MFNPNAIGVGDSAKALTPMALRLNESVTAVRGITVARLGSPYLNRVFVHQCCTPSATVGEPGSVSSRTIRWLTPTGSLICLRCRRVMPRGSIGVISRCLSRVQRFPSENSFACYSSRNEGACARIPSRLRGVLVMIDCVRFTYQLADFNRNLQRTTSHSHAQSVVTVRFRCPRPFATDCLIEAIARPFHYQLR